MTKTILIEQPHGYLKDDEGRVVQAFINWDTGGRTVPDAVAEVEYVDSPSNITEGRDEAYKPDTS